MKINAIPNLPRERFPGFTLTHQEKLKFYKELTPCIKLLKLQIS